jgi:ankyrin repeat protein
MPRWPKRNPRIGMDVYGRTDLFNFAFKGDIEGVKKEVASGASLNQGDDAGFTPLHIAIQEKRVDVVNFLLENGADPNQKDKYGNSPLWTAVYYASRANRTEANIEILRLLLDRGADPNQLNNAGRSPLQMVNETSNNKILKLLRNKKI